MERRQRGRRCGARSAKRFAVALAIAGGMALAYAGSVQGADMIAKFTLPGGGVGSLFGRAVAISGDYALVSGDSTTTSEAGVVCTYTRSAGGIWSWAGSVGGAMPTYNFGSAVALDGSSAMIGDNLNSDYAFNAGAVYPYSAGTLTLDAPFFSTEPKAGGASSDQFGRSVGFHNGQVIVGAMFNETMAVNAGAAFIGAPSSLTKLVAADGAFEDWFGNAVAIRGNYALVGSYMNDQWGTDGGAVYAYEQVGGVWTPKGKFAGSDTGPADEFGYDIAISGDTAVIGAYGYDLPAKSSCGAAYVFKRNATGGWDQVDLLTASDASTSAHFGVSVAISGDLILVGTPFTANGTAYLFQDDGTGNWTEIDKITAPDGAASDRFGTAVALDGKTALVGAIYDDDLGGSSGSAYFFAVPEPASLALLAAGGLLLGGRRRKAKSACSND